MVDNWDDKSKITTLKIDKELFRLLQAQELKFLKLASGISALLQAAASDCVPSVSERRVLLHREIIKVGYKFKAIQLFYSKCCLDTCSAQGVEGDVGGEMVQGSFWMAVRKAQQQTY